MLLEKHSPRTWELVRLSRLSVATLVCHSWQHNAAVHR